MKIINRTVLGVLSLFLVGGALLPFSAAAALDDSSEPINIEADRMLSNDKESAVVFVGNVDAKQGDLVIRTDEMTVYYVEDKNGSGQKNSSQVERLVCKGNVEISEGNWLGTGNRMNYYARERKVILSGDAKAWQGQNMVTGKTITYFLDEGRSIVEGPTTADQGPGGKKEVGKTGRVKAVIHPDADSKK